MTPNYWHAQLTQLAAAALPSPSPNAATAVSPHWKDVVTAANDTLRTRAILIGGAFAYFKYLRGRIHYASLALSLEPIVIEIDKRRALSITTTITNSGTYQMVFDMGCRQRVSLRCLDRLAELSPADRAEVDDASRLLRRARAARQLPLLSSSSAGQAR